MLHMIVAGRMHERTLTTPQGYPSSDTKKHLWKPHIALNIL